MRLLAVRTHLLRFLAAPLAALFGLGVELRLLLYRMRLLKRSSFSVPTISVGNLSVGGAGKTPHTEYLLRMLQEFFDVGTLSRGYGRKTSGFRAVNTQDSALDVGDEPLQLKRKFPKSAICVGEDRVFGISNVMQVAPQTKVVILDDAYQNLAIQPAINVLLTEYDRPYWRDHLMPVGRLREWPGGSDRADAIVITKCPTTLDVEQRQSLLAEMAPLPHQRVFFSRYTYGQPWLVLDPRYRTQLEADWDVLLVTAIARVDYLRESLDQRVAELHDLSFGDHHQFTKRDLGRMVRIFGEIENPKKIILTTEKDAMRLYAHEAYLREQNLPLFALPAVVEFLDEPYGKTFDQWIRAQLLAFRA